MNSPTNSTPQRPIFLDGHSTTPCDPRVREAMWPWFGECFGNASSQSHVYGHAAAAAVETARQQVAALFKVRLNSIVFTSGATESNNLVLKGVLTSPWRGRRLVTSAIEHKAILDPAKRLQRKGIEFAIAPVDPDGRVNVDRLADLVTPSTTLVSIMWANNETGVIQPIAEISKLCRSRGVLFHCDAAQAVGKVVIDLAQLPIDLLSFSAHKFNGPQGIGGLVIRRSEPRIPLEPQLDGGGQEHRFRSGTSPVGLIVGLGRAAEIATSEQLHDSQRVSARRDRLWAKLCELCPGIQRNGNPEYVLPGSLHVSFEGIDGELLLSKLTEVAVSSGSACTSVDPEPSHVLRAMGLSDRLALASLRFGLVKTTTEIEIERAAHSIANIVRSLRK